MLQSNISQKSLDVNNYLWRVLQAMISAANQGVNAIPGPTQTRPILVRGKERIELFRRHDEKLVFIYRNGGTWKLSKPLAQLGMDEGYIASRRAIWKLNGDRRQFDKWAEVLQ